ncbi:tripartite tricarboxylate transporter TctB family protein [Rothia kristinae]|uniref:tripartite tricarboxylate transporter TctB family protein n=2 Tax=Rothia kristinae TaxID=37923 RepID=UPI001CD43A47|nr:tripartite tricarboxylate transporter TctB family protein [Rothia kristinae]MCA1169067.1 tripartite tricarboxylate transporter TctB family protein [Rothia kristinae]MCT1358301.1 tripartite tricarboxylate transporter TctB family protein [Rothia kristinae]MCT1393870.1 tripartite tricarboxylate transporter TctB family protein [Rothia kristinae]MCT1506031.1 tripartite tricarboxylate transporter TctB family protein [Rothia kristinae]MCT2037975.1 tripartite tricarboxylate transporter TctB family 
MSENPHGSHPSQEPTPEGYPAPTHQSGQQQAGYPQAPYGAPQVAPQSKARNVVGIIAMICAILGTILACIPGILALGWILLPVGFIMGIVAVCLKGKVKWQGITAIIVSVVGTLIGLLVFFLVIADAVNDAVQDSDTSPSTSASSSAAAGSAAEETGKFGQTVQWDDGLKATVGEPQEFTPSESASVQGDGQARKFTITVHNGTDKAIDAMGISSTVQSGGKQADSVFDSAQNIEIPSGKIQPGKDLTFDVVYQVADPSDISFDLSIIDPDSLDTHEVTFVS